MSQKTLYKSNEKSEMLLILQRKIRNFIYEHLISNSHTVLLIEGLSVVPIEVKSGKDYTIHSALDKFILNKEYNIKRAYVLSNEQKIYSENGITYIPIYYIMFFQNDSNVVEQFLD